MKRRGEPFYPKDFEPIVAAARDAGWATRVNTKRHLLLIPPGGGKPIVVPGTSRSQRGVLNVRAEARRHGLAV